MKRILLLNFLLLIILELQAQLIAVKSFRPLSNDLDARTYYPKEDRNGEKAALIKIVTNETGFEFDAGSIGVVASVQKTGEIWLYIPHGSKAVTIKHPKFTLLRNYAYPQSIESGEVYEMVLTTDKVITIIEAQTIDSQWLVITSEPTGADVYINDQAAGKTPYQNELPVGKYTWRVSKELYLSEAGIAELIMGGKRQVMNLIMKPNFGTLNISSAPENGAKVFLNDMPTGKVTPCTIEMVKSGDHILSLSRNEYETTIQRLTLAAGETQKVVVSMNPTFAQITVTSEPAADIFINDQFKAKTNWVGRLNPGVYTFEARQEKYKTAIEKQTVRIGQPLTVKLNPLPITGNLRVVTTPYDAIIKINGKDMGQTPITLKNQLIGDYTIELSLQGYNITSEKITIAEGQTLEINTVLQTSNITETTFGLNLEMIFIKGCTFNMGNSYGESDEKPEFQVTLSDYYIGKTEVTQKQWRAVTGNNPSYFKNCDDCPVEQVSWDDIQDFLQKLNRKTGKKYRLPTEAEWEYASKAGIQDKRNIYSGSNLPSDVAWYKDNSGSKTHIVCQKQPNEKGIYDMSGNVYEWCNDWQGSYSSSSQTNPKGPSTGSSHMMRGGGWDSDYISTRSTYRDYDDKDSRKSYLGFRIALMR